MDQVNDQSTAYLTANFKDKDGAAATPTGVTYQVRKPGAIVRAFTAVSAASSVTITLTPSDNTLAAGIDTETREVTVIAEYGASDQVVDHYVYEVTAVGI